LEDDVTTQPGFVDAIHDFVAQQGQVCPTAIRMGDAGLCAHTGDWMQPWIMLEFSLLGFIGKLFHDESLPQLAWLFRVRPWPRRNVGILGRVPMRLLLVACCLFLA
jgi:hypothetical protein